MKVPFWGATDGVVILDSRDLTPEEWARVKASPTGSLQYRGPDKEDK